MQWEGTNCHVASVCGRLVNIHTLHFKKWLHNNLSNSQTARRETVGTAGNLGGKNSGVLLHTVFRGAL